MRDHRPHSQASTFNHHLRSQPPPSSLSSSLACDLTFVGVVFYFLFFSSGVRRLSVVVLRVPAACPTSRMSHAVPRTVSARTPRPQHDELVPRRSKLGKFFHFHSAAQISFFDPSHHCTIERETRHQLYKGRTCRGTAHHHILSPSGTVSANVEHPFEPS